MLTKTTNSLPYKALVVLFAICTLFSCNEDDPKPEALIFGEWTVESSMIDIYLDGESLVDYFIELYQIDIDEAELLEQNLIEDYLDTFQGTIRFNEYYTYVIEFGEEFDTGHWKLSEDGKILIFDEGTVDETTATILQLSSSILVVEIEDYEEVDIDGDGKDDDIELHVTMTLKK